MAEQSGCDSYAYAMAYPTTYPAEAADQGEVDLAGRACPRLTGSHEVARRLAELDERYICDSFLPLDELAARRNEQGDVTRAHIVAGRLPQPAYRLDDGTDMVPPDYFALVDAAGTVAALPRWFAERYRAAARARGLPADETAVDGQWREYLGGGYLVCLEHATPETIAEKALHITVLDSLLRNPMPDDQDWARRLRRQSTGSPPSSALAPSSTPRAGVVRCHRSGTEATSGPATPRSSSTPRARRKRRRGRTQRSAPSQSLVTRTAAP